MSEVHPGIHRVLDENGFIINSNVPGEVGKRKSDLNFKVNQPPNKSEPLLPAGFKVQDNGSIETPTERSKRLTKKPEQQKRKSTGSKEMLLPAGIELD